MMDEAGNTNYLKISDLRGESSFEVVKCRFSNGLEIVKCIYEFFLQLAGLEESFAHGLQKLLRSASYTLHSNTLMQWLGQDPFEETGTLREAWKLIGECLSLTAKHHLEKAYLLKQTVAEPLNEAKQQLDDIKKHNLKETKFTSIKKLKQQLKTEKLKLETITTECSKLRGQLDFPRVDSLSYKNPQKLEEQINIVEAQLRDQEQLCTKLKQEYSISERGANLQLEYAYNTIHDSEWIRISKIRTSLVEFSKVYSNTGPVYLQYCQKLALRMYDVDADSDIHEFVSAHEQFVYSQNSDSSDLEDLDTSHPVCHIPQFPKKVSSSNSHPLTHSEKNDLSPKREYPPVNTISKKPSPPKTLPTAPKPNRAKSGKHITYPIKPNEPPDSVFSSPASSKPIPPAPAPAPAPPPSHILHTSNVHSSKSDIPPPNTTQVSTAQNETYGDNADPVKSKIEAPTPYPALPILHKELKRTESNINEIVLMQEKLIKMSEASDYYRIINGSPEDDVEHLDELRRNITKRLHPDQFAEQPELQRKANSKLSYLNTIFTDVLCKEEIRKIYNILCQYRKAYSQITSQDMNSLKVAMEKFQKIYRFFKRNEVPVQLIQEVEMALKLLNACIKKVV